MKTLHPHHHLSDLAPGAMVTATLAALFVLFERTFLWLAALAALVALLPLPIAGPLSDRERYWRSFAAGALVVIKILIWLA